MSDQPFDQDAQPLEQTHSQRLLGMAADSTRRAALNLHVRETLDAAIAALQDNRADRALEILQEAAPRYTRFGGSLRHWKSEQ